MYGSKSMEKLLVVNKAVLPLGYSHLINWTPWGTSADPFLGDV